MFTYEQWNKLSGIATLGAVGLGLAGALGFREPGKWDLALLVGGATLWAWPEVLGFPKVSSSGGLGAARRYRRMVIPKPRPQKATAR